MEVCGKAKGYLVHRAGVLPCIVRICMFWDATYVLWGLRCSGIFGITTGAFCLSCFHLISHRSRSTSEPWYADSFPSRKIRCQPLPEPQCAAVRLRDGESRYARSSSFFRKYCRRRTGQGIKWTRDRRFCSLPLEVREGRSLSVKEERKTMPKERLDKLLASQGLGSRSDMQKAIRAGRVTIGGTVCRSPADKIDPEDRELCLDGRPIQYRRYLYLMMNKPAGILCVSRDPKVPTVVDLLPAEFRRKGLFPAGRLDRDTVGLVIITNDGDYAHRVLSPAKKVVKRYQALLDGPVGTEEVKAFAEGVKLADGTLCRPAALRLLPQEPGPLAEVEITEGKYHQVKRMFAAVGRRVLWLKRCAIGGLILDASLPEGGCRELTAPEQALVWEKCQ